jgi:PEP-CTERM motif
VQPNNPATNGPGRLTQTAGSTDFASGSTLSVRIGGDADNDASRSQLLNATGTLTFPNPAAGNWTVDVSKVAGYTPTAVPHTYTIAQAASIPSTGLVIPVNLTATGSGQLTASNGTTTLRVSGFAAGDSFTLSKQGNLIVLSFSPVPEPAAVIAVFGAGLGFAAWRRRARSAAIDS